MARKNMNIRKIYEKRLKKAKTAVRTALLSSGAMCDRGMLMSSQFSAGCWQAACRVARRGMSGMRILTKIS